MTFKVISFVENPEVINPQFEKEDNTKVNDVKQLGNNGNTYFFAIDSSNVSVSHTESNNFKEYDFANSDDYDAIKAVAGNFSEVVRLIDLAESKFTARWTLFEIAKNVAKPSDAFKKAVEATAAEKAEILAGFGLPADILE